MLGDKHLMYSVTTEGHLLVLQISEAGLLWSELPNSEKFLCKRASSGPGCLWAIGSDHQVHLYVHQSEVPIIVKEIAYENQRWNPVDGFSSRLLPSDRYSFSSKDGLQARELSSIDLPNSAWQWEDDWHLDLLLNGQPLEPEGWMYAIDFPRQYTSQKSWNSYVRRRKWVRNRRYSAVGSWVALPPLELDEHVELFLDVSAGGCDIPGTPTGSYLLWAVTFVGSLLFREGVGPLCPQGVEWLKIDTPVGWIPCQVSVGPTGKVWLVAWNGMILERDGVTWDRPHGTHWKEVKLPPGVLFSHVALGLDVAWAVDREGQVWMKERNTWKPMTSQMSMISVGKDTQICAVSSEDQSVSIRCGITSQESSGKCWQKLPSSLGGKDVNFTWTAFSNKNNDLSQLLLGLKLEKPETKTEFWRQEIVERLRGRILGDNFQNYENPIEKQDWVKTGRCRFHGPKGPWVTLELLWEECPLLTVKGDLTRYLSAAVITSVVCGHSCSLDIHSTLAEPVRLFFAYEEEAEDWAAHITKACSGYRHLSEKISEKSLWALTSYGDVFVSETAGPRRLEADVPLGGNRQGPFILKCPSELKPGCGFVISALVPENPERFSINLQCGEVIPSEKAFAAKRDVALHINPRFGDNSCMLVLNSFIENAWGQEERKENVRLKPGDRFTVKIECCRSHFRIDFGEEVVDYVHRMDVKQVTHVVVKGHVEDIHVSYRAPEESLWPQFIFWRQNGGHFQHIESSLSGVVWALGSDNTCWVHTGAYGGAFFKGLLSSSRGVHQMMDEDQVYIYENQRWNPVSGFHARGLPTDRPMWSDKTGRKYCTKNNTTLPNRHWTWISDWLIDYHPPGGADREGWQYAVDFPARYHGYKGILDYVRRRRWTRKCRFVTTGPWTQLGLSKLRDFSMQMNCSDGEDIPLWAVAHNGDILIRLGVSAANPQGKEWRHVASEYKFKFVSVGDSGRVWALTEDGMPVLRHGVSTTTPNGTVWLPIDRPEGTVPLKQVAAGKQQIWAIDDQNRLYRRREVLPIFPEGTGWDFVDSGVVQVSLGSTDEVWAVLESEKAAACGPLALRKDLKDNSCGSGWDVIHTGCWKKICARGFTTEKLVT